ncbi:DUF4396 domain-containing protein [Salinicola rhizosphaerae]|uniref:DUF4396 domain-containing protein n=1 Tax=Salinicola rhizosphaerae TaxID=1443141 RepID=A0ABQ3DUQ1_9GAMM|nr:DUF4396 domain-containing protein [Salinicola rhizosphaerae]GHB16331.1 hypothetical protein GCM10009038_13510 [Salinicola rhizosphaerae]
MLTFWSWIFLLLGIATAIAIAIDVSKRPQPMAVMNVTWPITGLYMPLVGWWAYLKMGRAPLKSEQHGGHQGHQHADHEHESRGHDAHDHGPHQENSHHGDSRRDGSDHQGSHHEGSQHEGSQHPGHGSHAHHHGGDKPKWQSVFVGVTHCGGGCTLGDSVAAPIVALTGFTVLGSTLLGHFVGAFIGAYLFGLAFQILPAMEMGEKNLARAFVNAVKADTVSLVAFEIGMFAWLTIAFLLILPQEPPVASATYWFMMQIAMLIGFATSYPANWWLISRGIKHGM